MSDSDTKVTHESLHLPTFEPADLLVAPGVELDDLQRKHAAIVLDIFSAKLTRGKLMDNFTEDAIYEDLFATCKDRTEVAGQLLNLPLILSSGKVHEYRITSAKAVTTSTAKRENIAATEIIIHSKHEFTFRAPLPESLKPSITDETDLIVYSTPEGICRIHDRPLDKIPDNSLLTAIRKFNAVAVPSVIPMPKNEEEDAEKATKQIA